MLKNLFSESNSINQTLITNSLANYTWEKSRLQNYRGFSCLEKELHRWKTNKSTQSEIRLHNVKCYMKNW